MDYSLVLEAIALARRDEYLRQALLRFVVNNFREDLKRMLGISFAGIRLEWSEDFEASSWSIRGGYVAPEILKYYKNLFMKYLEGRGYPKS